MTINEALGGVRRWASSRKPQPIIVYGGITIVLAFFWTVAVVHTVGESLLLLAPAGIVSNFFMPIWFAIIGLHIGYREGALRELWYELLSAVTRIRMVVNR
jgi:hypothetical protein